MPHATRYHRTQRERVGRPSDNARLDNILRAALRMAQSVDVYGDYKDRAAVVGLRLWEEVLDRARDAAELRALQLRMLHLGLADASNNPRAFSRAADALLRA